MTDREHVARILMPAMLLNRRGFLSFLAAPAIVHAGNLMPIKALGPSPIPMMTIEKYLRLYRPEWYRWAKGYGEFNLTDIFNDH